jgi:hypothetical protein
VRQGRTDAWIAHQLEATVQQIQAFKREQDLEANGDEPAAEEVDLRAQDDAAIAAAAPPGAPVAAAPQGARSRARSITARRATGCGSIPPFRTTPSTPSTGRATVPSRSRSRRTRS